MQLTKTLVALLVNFAVASMSPPLDAIPIKLQLTVLDAQCGTADACVGTETCKTFTQTTPTTTTFATCVPTPTCIGVYGNAHFPHLMFNIQADWRR